MTREVGMKIYEQNRISSTLQFNGLKSEPLIQRKWVSF